MPNFAEALNVNTDEIERPPLAPTGHYRFKVSKTTMDKTASGEWEIVNFQMQGVEATEDVDPDELSNAGGINQVRMRHSFMFPTSEDEEAQAMFKQSLFNLKRFLNDHLGIEPGVPLSQSINMAPGHECIASVVHKQDKNDPDLYHANIGRTAPV